MWPSTHTCLLEHYSEARLSAEGHIILDITLTDGRTELNANRYKYWRWTPRHAMLSFVYMGLIPGVLGYFAYNYEV